MTALISLAGGASESFHVNHLEECLQHLQADLDNSASRGGEYAPSHYQNICAL